VDWNHLAKEGNKVVGSCEHGNEPLDCMKDGEFLD